MKRIMAFLLTVLLFLPFISSAEQTAYRKEENTGRDKDSYPYIIRMPSAVWYLAKADIELLGEDAFYKGELRLNGEKLWKKSRTVRYYDNQIFLCVVLYSVNAFPNLPWGSFLGASVAPQVCLSYHLEGLPQA